MDLSPYSEQIQELDRRQDEYLSILDERALPILDEMLEVAMQTNDPRLIGYVYHTMSFAEFFITGRYNLFIKYLRQATKYITKSGDPTELTHIYYLIALDALNKGMIDISHRFFLESRSLAGKIGIGLAAAIMDLNIAQVLMRIDYFEDARKFVKSSISAIRGSKSHIYHYKNLTTLYMEDVLICIELGKVDEARKVMNTAERHVARHRELLTGATLLKYEITKLRMDMLDRAANIQPSRVKQLCESIQSTPNIYSYTGDLYRLCKQLIKKRKRKWVKQIIDALERNKPEDGATRALRLFAEIKIEYYKAVKDDAELEAAYREHDRALALYIKDRKDIYRYVTDLAKFTGNIRRTRKIAISEQDQLTQIAKIDGLTNIPNRYGANLYLDEVFEKAYKNGTKLGVVYLDLDGLKFINDTQGHLAGDACLIRIGELLTKHMEAGEFFAARYGGDEFMLIFDNATTREIERSLNSLRKESDVKFSRGIYNDTPKGREKSWQYIELADKALYEDKKRKGARQ